MTGATYLKKSKEAIQEMGDRNGASLSAIKKYFEENFENEYDFKNNASQRNHLKKTLSEAIEENVLYHPNNSAGKYKISPQSTPSKKKNSKKRTSKKSPAKKSPTKN